MEERDYRKDDIFREQMESDIALLQENLAWDKNIKREEYAFNYWVLSNIYSLAEETCSDNITEYKDKGIDCFVHYEEDKELYLIQNKYYAENTKLNSKEVSDFLARPIATLNKGVYKNSELQKIYDQAKEDKNYKIFLHFYVTNDSKNQDVTNLFNDYKNENVAVAKIFYLKDIKEKYYGESFKENKKLDFAFKVINERTYLAIGPEYGLENMVPTFYVTSKVSDIYDLWKKANENDYELFEENIREYLGGGGKVNKGIIKTLKDEKDRVNFFYYNNGITIICDEAKADAQEVKVKNPQVVNGCQTVNSIAEVLKNKKAEDKFEEIYVVTKIIVLNEQGKDFYRTIVKYTNSQNAINEKAFGAVLQPFFTIQKNL